MIQRKRSQYALRAVFELAKRQGTGPVKISEIAQAQGIPSRFLEVILSHLKGSGFVESKRGFTGGYLLIPSPDQISVGDILRFLQGELPEASCLACVSKNDCPAGDHCSFLSLWRRVKVAMDEIYDHTTFQDLLNREEAESLNGL